jgi:hypothetical protein
MKKLKEKCLKEQNDHIKMRINNVMTVYSLIKNFFYWMKKYNKLILIKNFFPPFF